jgi:hypothetical protein
MYKFYSFAQKRSVELDMRHNSELLVMLVLSAAMTPNPMCLLHNSHSVNKNSCFGLF